MRDTYDQTEPITNNRQPSITQILQINITIPESHRQSISESLAPTSPPPPPARPPPSEPSTSSTITGSTLLDQNSENNNEYLLGSFIGGSIVATIGLAGAAACAVRNSYSPVEDSDVENPQNGP